MRSADGFVSIYMFHPLGAVARVREEAGDFPLRCVDVDNDFVFHAGLEQAAIFQSNVIGPGKFRNDASENSDTQSR